MTTKLALGACRMGNRNMRQFFSITQNIGGHLLQMETSIKVPSTLPLNAFKNVVIGVTFIGIRKSGYINSRCRVRHNGQYITCLIPNIQLPSAGDIIDVPIKKFL
jgi:hypothetical protein